MRFALGAMWFGTSVRTDDAFTLLDRFVDAGGRVIDTSNNYPFWVPGTTGDESETALGAWLAARGIRDDVVVSTKVGARPRKPGDTTLHDPEGLSAPAIRAGIQDSLRRLGTDHVDVYWAHLDDRSVPLEETVGAFDELVRAGQVVAVGASNAVAWRVERARAIAAAAGQTPYTALQMRHTYIRPRPGTRHSSRVQEYVTDETMDYLAAEPDVSLWVYSVLLSGAFTRADRPIAQEYQHPGTDARLAVIAKIAADLGVTVNHVILAWLMADGITPIVGASTLEQLEVAIEADQLKLDDDVRAALDAPK